MNIILMAIPLFLLLIIIELIVDFYRGTQYYRFNDFISSINIGIFSRVTGILKSATAFSVYYVFYQHYAFFKFEPSVQLWIFAFVGYDLAYYWSHRLNHRIAVMWGSHVVHHSSEEYNLSTALRQSGSFSLFGWAVYLPLALVGVSPEMLLVCGSLNLIYQFWVHTRHINKMPKWFETIFVTPSHHRVHHALNRDYIDKNFSGVFIIWDKIFHSFQAEKPTVDIVYGVSHQLKSFNPIWANLQVYYHLCLDAVHTKAWRDKLRLWFKPPGWRPDDVIQSHPRNWVTTKTIQKYNVAISFKIKIYLLIHFIILLGLTVLFLIASPTLSLTTNVMLCIVAIINLWGMSAIQENKAWAIWAESFRLFVTSVAVVIMLANGDTTNTIVMLLIFGIISLLIFYFSTVSNQSSYEQTQS
jgi:sterol desaturase/sphingolipid hydroxylase (fatty acid hydroxylase superfamily)